MTQDIIRMGKESGIGDCYFANPHPGVVQQLIRFAALVRADERERIIAANAPEIERCNAYIKELEEAMPPKILRAIRARGEA